MRDTDIVLLESQELSDADNAGGRASGRVIVDGAVNNLFPDISRAAATRGEFRLRKVYAAVRTATTERLYGPHVILSDIPADGMVSAVMFSTHSHTDARSDAQDRVESYVVAGTESRWRLMERHLAGLRNLQLWGSEDAPMPEIGEVFCVIDEGATPSVRQFVRVTGVSTRTQTFRTDECDEFDVQVADVEIADPLRFEISGPTPTCLHAQSPVKVRLTIEASAADYYGTSRLAQPAVAGSTTVYASAVRVPLAPSSQRENPLIDVPALPTRGNVVQAGSTEVATARWWIGGPSDLRLPCPATPGTVRINRYNAYGSGSTYLADNGDGTASDGSRSATLDYASGRIHLINTSHSNYYYEVAFVPGAARHDPVRTMATDIDASNRRYSYVNTLNPSPAPGTVLLEYRALGRWYRVTDAGDGSLDGDGVGVIDYGTGSISVTLSALPDTDSALLWSWGNNDGYIRRDGGTIAGHIQMRLTTASREAGSAVISWVAGGVAKSAAEDSDGVLSGDGNGVIDSVGVIDLVPDALPDGPITTTWTQPGDPPAQQSMTVDSPVLEVIVNEHSSDRIVEGSLVLGIGGARYFGRNGNLYRDPGPQDGAGTFAGTVDCDAWNAAVTSFEGGVVNEVTVLSLLTEIAPASLTSVDCRTPGAPIRPSGLSLTAMTVGGSRLFVQSNDLGQLYGDGTGAVDYESGIYRVAFDDSVIASSITLNCVTYSSVPQSAELIGIDPVRLPTDGKVAIFARGNLVVVFDTHELEISALSAGASYSTGFVNISRMMVVDANDAPLTIGAAESPAGGEHLLYDDLSGRIDVPADADLTGFTAPFTATFQYDDMAIANDVEIGGRIELSGALGNSYGTTAMVASAVQFTDLGASVTDLHDLKTWSNAWSDQPTGEAATGTYNTITYPVQVDNIGATTERWAVYFTSATKVRVMGETVGVIADGLDVTAGDVAPLNPETDTPFFVLTAAGFGGGWSPGNALRFNTHSAQGPIWIARTVTPGALAQRSDRLGVQVRGNAG